MSLTFPLVVAAATVGSVHTLAPDHWVPFAAVARAGRWSPARTAIVTGLCGLGHVTVSALLGLASAWFGLELVEAYGHRLEALAGVMLIAFGVVYALWGVHVSLRGGWHEHADGHVHWHRGPHAHSHARHTRMTAWTLFLLFSADPCVAVIPLIFAAAPLGWTSVAIVIVAYEVATIGTMIALVLPARAVVSAADGGWADRFGDAVAGAVIAITGIAVVGFGW